MAEPIGYRMTEMEIKRSIYDFTDQYTQIMAQPKPDYQRAASVKNTVNMLWSEVPGWEYELRFDAETMMRKGRNPTAAARALSIIPANRDASIKAMGKEPDFTENVAAPAYYAAQGLYSGIEQNNQAALAANLPMGDEERIRSSHIREKAMENAIGGLPNWDAGMRSAVSLNATAARSNTSLSQGFSPDFDKGRFGPDSYKLAEIGDSAGIVPQDAGAIVDFAVRGVRGTKNNDETATARVTSATAVLQSVANANKTSPGFASYFAGVTKLEDLNPALDPQQLLKNSTQAYAQVAGVDRLVARQAAKLGPKVNQSDLADFRQAKIGLINQESGLTLADPDKATEYTKTIDNFNRGIYGAAKLGTITKDSSAEDMVSVLASLPEGEWQDKLSEILPPKTAADFAKYAGKLKSTGGQTPDPGVQTYGAIYDKTLLPEERVAAMHEFMASRGSGADPAAAALVEKLGAVAAAGVPADTVEGRLAGADISGGKKMAGAAAATAAKGKFSSDVQSAFTAAVNSAQGDTDKLLKLLGKVKVGVGTTSVDLLANMSEQDVRRLISAETEGAQDAESPTPYYTLTDSGRATVAAASDALVNGVWGSGKLTVSASAPGEAQLVFNPSENTFSGAGKVAFKNASYDVRTHEGIDGLIAKALPAQTVAMSGYINEYKSWRLVEDSGKLLLDGLTDEVRPKVHALLAELQKKSPIAAQDALSVMQMQMTDAYSNGEDKLGDALAAQIESITKDNRADARSQREIVAGNDRTKANILAGRENNIRDNETRIQINDAKLADE